MNGIFIGETRLSAPNMSRPYTYIKFTPFVCRHVPTVVRKWDFGCQ